MFFLHVSQYRFIRKTPVVKGWFSWLKATFLQTPVCSNRSNFPARSTCDDLWYRGQQICKSPNVKEKKVAKRWKPAEEILHCCSEWILLSHGAWHSAIIVICSPAFLFHCQQIYAIRTDRSIQRGMLCCECLFGGVNLPTDRSHDELL